MENSGIYDFKMVELLFSAERISGYESEEQHEENIALICSITHKICVLELVVRNKIDRILREQLGDEWIRTKAKNIKVKNKYGKKEKIKIDGDLTKDCHNKLVSQQSLGFWVKIIDFYKIHDQIFANNFIDEVNFKKYYYGNQSKFRGGSRLMRPDKTALILRLLLNLRNRCFHWESLFRLNSYGKPRLNAHYQHDNGTDIIINLQSDKIVIFLDDLISYFAKDLINYGMPNK